MANVTDLPDPLVEDLLEEFENESSEESTLQTVGYIWAVSTFLIKAILCLVNISASIFLAVIIMKFRRLRTRVNIYLFNYAICNALYYLFTPFVYILFGTIDLDYNRKLHCCVDTFDEVFFILMFAFVGLSAVECYTVHLKDNLSYLYRKTYKYLILIVYILGILKVKLGIVLCLTDNRESKHYLLITGFLVYFTAMNVLNFHEYKKRKMCCQRIRYPLIIANIVFYCWFPLFIYYIIELYILPAKQYYEHKFVAFVLFTEFIPQFVAHGHTVVVVYMLGKLNKYFKMAYIIAFKRKFRNYEPSDLDQSEEESAVYHQVNGQKDQVVNTREMTPDDNLIEVSLT